MIRVENLSKSYGKRLALDNVSFKVEKGEIVGLLGPNGAGKTTAMRILTGYLAPSGGQAWVGGHNMLTESLAARRHIGYLPELVPLYTDMTVRNYLSFLARLRGYDVSKINNRIADVVSISHLEEYADTYIGKLSKGFKQRVGVAQAIVHEPDVLILDEPTVGIDPIQVTQTRQLIKELGKEHTVILSTHILPEVSSVCERVIIINEGKIAAEDNIDNLSRLLAGSKRIRLEIQGPPLKIAEKLRQVSGVSRVTFQDPYYLVEYPESVDVRGSITEALARSGFTLLSLETISMSLEDIFLKLTTVEETKK